MNKKSKNIEQADFAAGCFWKPEEMFRKLKGVIDTRVGYEGGYVPNPTYEQVCGLKTGHAETLQVDYDPESISYTELLDKFFEIHDPTQVNRQGPDVGENYRSAIFYHDENQKKLAEEKIDKLDKSKKYSRPIATKLEPAKDFYRAEEYHQQYLKKRNMGIELI
jgi:peptide-methionine (S)-S-oxide reductase